MNLFETMLLDLMLVSFPLIIYLIYTIYTKTLDVEKNNLFLDVALFSSCYLLIKFGILEFNGINILIFDIPLIIAYLRNKKISFTTISIILIYFYKEQFDIAIYIYIVEYLIYFILYLTRRKYKINDLLFTNIFIIIKITMFLIYNILTSSINNNNFITFIILITIFHFITNSIIQLYNKTDEIFNMYGQIRDIEKEKQIKKSIFKITHEIKNPIAVCKGYLDMFDTNNIEHSNRYVPILKSEINRVLFLLEDFLSITKIKIEKEEMDLNMLIEDTVDCLKPILDNKKIKFLCDIEDNEIYINADYNRLKQTLVNIIKNSKEAIEENGTIKLYTKNHKNKVKIFIEDDGVGMSSEQLEKIKEAFFTTKSNGTGLGTYLSNEIISLHNGTLEYFSKKEIGTKVVITIPI